jgi:uncharacterized cupredoxin-like copper-binding protein
MIHLKARTFLLAISASLSLGAAAKADEMSMAAVDPNVIVVGMTNKPDGSQVMTLTETSVHAGSIVFQVMNHSENTVHEFLVLKTDLAPGAFPMTPDGTRVDEDKLPGIQELGDLEPGKSGQMKMTLAPGRYVLFCNQPGHFTAGMAAVLAVAP